jgi:anti-anti-sigma regulatory factor
VRREITVQTESIPSEVGSESAVQIAQQALDRAGNAEGEIVLDFSSVRRIDPAALQLLEQLARETAAKGVAVVLRSINIDVYRVLKLMKLTERFSFQA